MDAYIELTIEDTGFGIRKEDLSSLFSPFFFMEVSAGHIVVESELDTGTTFHLYFPVADIKRPEISELPKANIEVDLVESPDSGCILFVDDEELIVELFEDFLSAAGYEIFTCSNGAEALKIFKADPEKFDLLVTDQTMPKLTGTRLASQIHEIRHDLPIILLSGDVYLIDDSRISDFGIVSVINKPTSPTAVLESIREILQ